MGIFRDSKNPPAIDLRRPRIPKAPPLPQIRGPRGGLAYQPDPRDPIPALPTKESFGKK
jgi:hypothetical protein